MKNLFTYALVALFLVGCKSKDSIAKAEENQQKQEELRALIDSGEYEFTAQWAYPMRNNLVNLPLDPNLSSGQINLLGNPNYIRVKNDSAQIDMPFFGVARSAPYGKSANPFDGQLKDYNVEEKKGKFIITFTASDGSQVSNYTITAISKNSVDVSVNSSWRDNISYRGEIKSTEKDM